MTQSEAFIDSAQDDAAAAPLRAQLQDDHDARAALCTELELLADGLPALPAPARVRRLCNQIETVTSIHFRRADSILVGFSGHGLQYDDETEPFFCPADARPADKKEMREKLLGMGSGYVLNFSDRTFGEFFDEYRIEINSERYKTRGTSKANRLRTFWELDTNHTVGRAIDGLIKYASDEQCFGDSNLILIEDCRKLARRLLSDQPVVELDALTAMADERDFEMVAEHVRDAIEKNQPEAGLDRLHTFVNKFVRVICEPHGFVKPPADRWEWAGRCPSRQRNGRRQLRAMAIRLGSISRQRAARLPVRCISGL